MADTTNKKKHSNKLNNKQAVILLGQQIEQLLTEVTQLRIEKQQLHQQNEALLHERSTLIKKNELARNRVETMIHRLQALESEV